MPTTLTFERYKPLVLGIGMTSSDFSESTNVGGILLCGGKSTRMGRPKALLPYGSTTMIEHVLATLGQVVQPLAVVAAVGQELPSLAPAKVVWDERAESGPLEALRVGLATLAPSCHAAFVTSCDVPLLQTSFVQFMVSRLGNFDAVIPFDGGFAHPLAGVYRTNLVPIIESLIAEDLWRPRFLLDRVRCLKIDVEELRQVDPDLDSLRNINRPEDYESLK
jgi:molybdopterin-guanine dinucleotide biosynthesis protein A